MKISLVTLFSILLAFSLTSSVMLPAYAEVVSFQTNSAFYKGGNQIQFSGKIASGDSPYVNIVIYGPNNNYLLLTSGIADNNNAFQITVDTSTTDNQQKFSVKGIYNATAFLLNKASGKTVNFVYSPDASAMAPSSPASLTATAYSSTEIFLNWSAPALNGGSQITGYKIERNDGNGFFPIQNTITPTFQDIGLTPSKQYSYRVSAINSAGTSTSSNNAYATTLSAPILPIPTNSSMTSSQNNVGTTQINNTQAIYEEIQKRIENAKRLQQLLQSKSNQVSLNEKVGLGDSIGNTSSNAEIMSGNKTDSLDFNNFLFPLIALAGAGIIVTVIYLKKNKLWFSSNSKSMKKHDISDTTESVKKEDDFIDEDYSFMILKNRLAKGEITIEEFNRLKNALKEP